MIEIVTTVLTKIAEAFLGALVGKLTDQLWPRLQGDHVRQALKEAFGKAIEQYANVGLRLELVGPLKDGLLTDPVVVAELVQLARFEREPDAALIGRRWKAMLDDPPRYWDFTEEARRFLRYLEQGLRGTEVFRPIFDAKLLDAIAAGSAKSTESLEAIIVRLDSLMDLLPGALVPLFKTISQAAPGIQQHVIDRTRFIAERSRDFVGRQFVFEGIDRFIGANPRGYYFVRGDPGIGKSALAAHLVKTRGYVHHFNIRSEGSNTAAFLGNICAQLIARYQLNHHMLPESALQNGQFLNRLLEEVSNKLAPGEKAIIVVDALDEVADPVPAAGGNILYLPPDPPPGIYFIATVRRDFHMSLRTDIEPEELIIEHDSPDNLADIQVYVSRSVYRLGIQAYIAAQEIDDALFVEHLLDKSEGNFMYLRYVLPEIEAGTYKDLSLDALPKGLARYYEDHWQRMGMMTPPLPHTKIRVVYILAKVVLPWPRNLIARAAGENELTVQEILDEWKQFLHLQLIDSQTCYSIYHASFRDFLYRQDIVQAAGLTLPEIDAQLGNYLYDRWSEGLHDLSTG
jgi:hypothetical protein